VKQAKARTFFMLKMMRLKEGKLLDSCSYESINAKVYNNENSKNAIKLLIRSLRKKIDKTSIVNVSGFGYKLNMVSNQ